MTNQQMHETGFWAGLVQRQGENYVNSRQAEYADKTRYFDPFWTPQEGLGLEVGCGCVSVLDGCGKKFISLDPLMDYYTSLVHGDMWKKWNLDSPICYMRGDSESLNFDDAHFAWLFCVNMIDHTPDPAKALDEMYRVLKPGGRLYFEVHFDDSLSPAHYGLWNEGVVRDAVDSRFGDPLQKTTVRLDEHNQSNYWAVYEK